MKISIIVPDRCVIIDDTPLWFSFSSLLPSVDIHAIQWDSVTGQGGVEYSNGLKTRLINGGDYLKPFIEAYKAEKSRLEQEVVDKLAQEEAQMQAEKQAAIDFRNSPEQVALREANAAKLQEILDNLPTWKQVSTAIDDVSSLAEIKTILKKLARVLYLVAKDSTQ